MKNLLLKIFISIFCLFLFSLGSGNLNLGFKGDENFYFESAKEMFETKDFVTPRYMGEERFQKPILFYWLVLLSFRIFGVNWFAARFPSILFGTFLALLVFSLSNLLFRDRKMGLFAALFAATTPLYYRYARLTVPDMTLVFFMTLSIYFFLMTYIYRRDRINPIFFTTALALAFLVKGPVGVVIPLLTVTIFCLIRKEKVFGIADAAIGLIIFLVMTIPWFYLVYKTHGEEYITHIWQREILQRLSGGDTVSFAASYFKGLIFYLGVLLTKFFPFSLFIPAALVVSSSFVSERSAERYEESEKNAHLFLILWLVITFLFFTFVIERRAHYLLALSPAVSILAGSTFEKAISERQFFSRFDFSIPYFVTLAGILLFTGLYIFSDSISGGDNVGLWKYSLLIGPVILVLGYRYRGTSLMPLSLVLSLSSLYIVLSAYQPFHIFSNKMEYAGKIIKSEFKDGDRIGICSHGIIPEELQVFFQTPVENVKVMYNKDSSPNYDSASKLLDFLNSKEKVFGVIKRKDYEVFLPGELKGRLRAIGKYYVWKRRIRFDVELKEPFSNLGKVPLREIFQNEIYIITNKK